MLHIFRQKADVCATLELSLLCDHATFIPHSTKGRNQKTRKQAGNSLPHLRRKGRCVRDTQVIWAW